MDKALGVPYIVSHFQANLHSHSKVRSLLRDREVSAHVANRATEEIDIDPHRIHQVVANLVSNAVGVMSDGGSLHVEVDNSSITITDSGPGIPEDQLESVFDRFVKAADSTGSGLGLSIARDLVEAHGGTLTVENRPEGGARFTVELG